MRYTTLRRIQYTVMAVCLLALLGIGFVIAQMNGYVLPNWADSTLATWTIPSLAQTADRGQIGLIRGHAGSDSGAICTDADGTVILAEAEINAAIAEIISNRLQQQRLDVLILDEYDERLQGLKATLLLSLHSDSCVDSSGYKAARHPNSPVAAQEDTLIACLDQQYSQQTGLRYHPDTLTHDMFEYHAFNKVAPETPAVILEMGFMGGDQRLLSTEQSLVAKGITDSILCFLESLEEIPQ